MWWLLSQPWALKCFAALKTDPPSSTDNPQLWDMVAAKASVWKQTQMTLGTMAAFALKLSVT